MQYISTSASCQLHSLRLDKPQTLQGKSGNVSLHVTETRADRR
ncbi:hypothetical protein L798_01965 [Zootermopsis nevadensis]|uniref:Uncharacterized protein n=1 Tax=Zootermopsis nevadensis TaxID=136037 RepID=A0A067QIA6_ZOONE|nr:hypothetical protein L798_01965 [Zootermopsis nevadensis]